MCYPTSADMEANVPGIFVAGEGQGDATYPLPWLALPSLLVLVPLAFLRWRLLDVP